MSPASAAASTPSTAAKVPAPTAEPSPSSGHRQAARPTRIAGKGAGCGHGRREPSCKDASAERPVNTRRSRLGSGWSLVSPTAPLTGRSAAQARVEVGIHKPRVIGDQVWVACRAAISNVYALSSPSSGMSFGLVSGGCSLVAAGALGRPSQEAAVAGGVWPGTASPTRLRRRCRSGGGW
jgi:hypothetical protein